jgi:hypothetical protein
MASDLTGNLVSRSDGDSYMTLRIFMLACGMVTLIGTIFILSFFPPVRGEYDAPWPDPLLVSRYHSLFLRRCGYRQPTTNGQEDFRNRSWELPPGCESSTLRSAFWQLINVMFGVLWYASRYGSEKTHNPDWKSPSDDEVREYKYNLYHSKAKQIIQAQGYPTPTPKCDLRPNPLDSHLQKPTLLH